LREHDPAWSEWFIEEKANLERLIGKENIIRISHYGSTAVPGLLAKPTVDILLEIKENIKLNQIPEILPHEEYITQWRDLPDDPLMFYKGYTPTGFAEKVFHIHVRYHGDWEELRFRDYLINNPEAAAEYASLKHELFKRFEYDRDGYTEAKTEFIRKITDETRDVNDAV
jgi:GrpB-like predicted nucleotidyltransferase (UPF0157 family)